MPIHVRFQLAVVRVIRKLARTADRRVITRQSSTGIQFLDDCRQEGRAVGPGRNPDSRAEKKIERKGKKRGVFDSEENGCWREENTGDGRDRQLREPLKEGNRDR